MTIYEFIKNYVRAENEIHFLDKNDISIGMIPRSKLVDEWIESPVICEDTWKAKPMPNPFAGKILTSEFLGISAGVACLHIQANIDANDILILQS